MNTTKFDNKSTKVVAHRGLSGIERENTNAAFIAAGNRNYFGVETDVHVTKDGQFVIAHDSIMERVSGSSLVIEESTFAMLRSIILYEKNGESNLPYVGVGRYAYVLCGVRRAWRRNQVDGVGVAKRYGVYEIACKRI